MKLIGIEYGADIFDHGWFHRMLPELFTPQRTVVGTQDLETETDPPRMRAPDFEFEGFSLVIGIADENHLVFDEDPAPDPAFIFFAVPLKIDSAVSRFAGMIDPFRLVQLGMRGIMNFVSHIRYCQNGAVFEAAPFRSSFFC